MSGPHKAHVDEEDLDELDDVLEQFSTPPAKAHPTPKSTSNPPSTAATATSSSSAPRTSKSPQPSTSTSTAEPLDFGTDFEKELAAGMASLFREISADAGLDSDALKVEEGDGEMSEEERKRREAFQAAWERMLVEGMDGAMDGAMDVEELVGTSKGKGRETDLGAGAMGSDGAEEKAGNGNGNGGAVPEDDFQASIRKAMDKLKESDSNLQADTEGSLDDLVQKLTAGLDLGSGGESDEELQKMLENMMTQLMSKDILYEPLKEMHVKFPDYLKDNEAKISPEDKKRYLSQQTATAKIVAIFDNPLYSETNQDMNAQIATLMNEMQSYGAPPAEIMGPLPPNFDLDADGMPKLPDNCVIA